MKICVTGQPGSGKTTAINYVKSAGYNVFIVDEYVHSIYKANKPGYKAILKAFGSKYVTSKEVNRKALGTLVFKNKKALDKLNNTMNPIIKSAIKKLPQNKTWFIELATYLLYPQNFANIFDKTLLIFSDKNFKKVSQSQKFGYLKKIPTIFVEKSKKTRDSIFNIDNKMGSQPIINVDFFVNNSKNKKFLKNNILKICKNINQHIIK